MRCSLQVNRELACNPTVQAVWRGCALAVNELLRHFWPCFPLSSPARRAKAERLRKALSEQYDT